VVELEHGHLIVLRRIPDVDLDEEAVELRFREGIGASYSIGFWVATTRNGSGSRWASPSTDTWPSCMASSKADCVLGGVRLTSSASRTLVNTGPGRKASSPPRNVTVPVMSDGSMSGVNWIRRKSTPKAFARALASSVLATPGTPSNKA